MNTPPEAESSGKQKPSPFKWVFCASEVLARDEIWGVRKASVESLAEVATVMPVEVRNGTLVELFRDFHDDGSRWVRIAACQALGPFIATLPTESISADLLALLAAHATEERLGLPKLIKMTL